jgi:hypothetical protein
MNLPPPFQTEPCSSLTFPAINEKKQSFQVAFQFVTVKVAELVETEELGEAGAQTLAELLAYFRDKSVSEAKANKLTDLKTQEDRLIAQIAVTAFKTANEEELSWENNKATIYSSERLKRKCTAENSFWNEDAEEEKMESVPVMEDSEYDSYAVPQVSEEPFPSQAELEALRTPGSLDFRVRPNTRAEV